MPRISSAERRSALIEAAVRVISRDGIQAATTRAIVAEANMSLASFHYVFRSRDEMMRELIAFVVGAEADAALRSIGTGRDIRTALREALQTYFDLLTSAPRHEQVMFELLHYSLRTPELEDLPRQQYASYHSAVAALLTTGAEHGGVRWTRPVDDIARMIVTITDGVTLAWLADHDDAAANRVLDFAADAIAAYSEPLPAGDSVVPSPSALTRPRSNDAKEMHR
ncbi:TetR/AcrR family transcriptional regulator [Glaciihabitans sp. dw_435]|uniref:TetR/AcrR family transcriptional regulator n=1 Tax=Glaciihabitans sp. dw_435 TaxID=2720081 RepID=UPI001BD410B0|nr:TetR family transcriptional regulator C-terminal domain-containing protein [Glaciihabitans sp. dw_435]